MFAKNALFNFKMVWFVGHIENYCVELIAIYYIVYRKKIQSLSIFLF